MRGTVVMSVIAPKILATRIFIFVLWCQLFQQMTAAPSCSGRSGPRHAMAISCREWSRLRVSPPITTEMRLKIMRKSQSRKNVRQSEKLDADYQVSNSLSHAFICRNAKCRDWVACCSFTAKLPLVSNDACAIFTSIRYVRVLRANSGFWLASSRDPKAAYCACSASALEAPINQACSSSADVRPRHPANV